MAALCPGVQYGLSSQENFGENKDLIFVKLTDSSIRAIEEYIKNQNKYSYQQTPTIKFQGNEGQLAFPSLHNGSGFATFKFSMSSTEDMEGKGGSFECVHQTARNSLNVLGSIPHKIRILANEDVYDMTRQRMTVAEEIHKNKCTREIKPNQTDIGRKVKLKQSRTTTAPPPMPMRKDPPPTMRESLLKSSSISSYQPNNNLPSKPMVHSSVHNGMSNGFGSNHVSSSRPPQNKPSVPDIARRPIKERLIHLLALRPFKKPELYERINKEGLRERNGMTSVLKQISVMKDNCYHLNRAMWNDVHDEWPFYTESERIMLKRRKPQNLTPPGSSDGGSSGSGQSPTSTHPGSPPPISSSKRPGYYDGADGFPTKRQRISHYRKPAEQIYRPPVENNSQRRPVTDSRDASNMNPRSRESPTLNGYPGSVTTNNYLMLNDKRNLSDEEDNASRKRSCDSHSLSFGVNREKTFISNNYRSSSPVKIPDDTRKEVLGDRNNGLTYGSPMERNCNNESWEKEQRNSSRFTPIKVSSSPPPHNSPQSIIARVSPDSQSELISPTDSGPPPKVESNKLDKKNEFPDYLFEYTTIKSADQRRRYKSDFNADYAEYRGLHGIVEKVSRRFAELEERLKQEDSKSPRYKDIKKQIVREYTENKKDLEQQRCKKRFQYLHDKLSHIKRLVLEYDQGTIENQY